VHDTSASTLLMVGLGEVRGDEEWLPAQVRRDIAALDGTVLGVDGDLVEVLQATAAQAPVEVELRTDVDDAVTPPEVVAALAGAAGEALRNVHRHAGTGRASVHVCRRDERVVVVVADDGRGFEPGAVAEGRSGLAVSVHERMALAGGRATVESGAGAGTRVRLEWPGG
jgi:signal transduction histidine kinase